MKNRKKWVSVIGMVILLVVGIFVSIKINTNDNIAPERSEASSDMKTWAYWWPSRSTPWLFEIQKDNSKWMRYDHDRDYSKLKKEVEDLSQYHKPNILIVFFQTSYIQQPKWLYGNGPKPEGNAKIDQIVDSPDYAYYDDLFELTRQEGIEVIIYPVLGAYGGQLPYPYSYVRKLNWFWARPDWGPTNLSPEEKIAQGYGIANPNTDAMRHPKASQNGSDYNWFEHGAGYENVDLNSKHFANTTNGFEDTYGFGQWSVYESPDMVFNGYDVRLSSRHIHTPIPSFSSQAYRDYLNGYYSELAERYSNDPGVLGYFIYQEPTYAHLRENMNYESGFIGDTNAGNANWYEVDYSRAELNRYNTWRKNKGLSNVSEIPYPIDAKYNEFRQWNLADFENELATYIREQDTDAKIMISLFTEESINLGEVNHLKQVEMIQPDIITIEPARKYDSFSNVTEWQNYMNSLKAVSPNLDTHLSHWILGNQKDSIINTGVTDFYTPGFDSGTNHPQSVGPYAHWLGDSDCAGSTCILRYQSSNTKTCIPSCVGKQCGASNGCSGTCGDANCKTPTPISTTTSTPTGSHTPTVSPQQSSTPKPNLSSTPPSSYKDEDLDKNGNVGINDFKIFLKKYAVGDKVIDFNNNDKFERDIGDFVVFADVYREENVNN